MKLSQFSLAERLGVSHTSVLRWETGESGVSNEKFAEIARCYGITVAELASPPDEADRARQMHRLLTVIPTLDETALLSLANLAEQLSRRS